MRFQSIKLRLNQHYPIKRSLQVEPEVYAFLSSGDAIALKPLSEDPFKNDDMLLFDAKFSDSLMITYVDALHGDFEAYVLTYEVPEKAVSLLEVFRVKTGDTTQSIRKVYKISGDSAVPVYTERLGRRKGDLRALADALGVSLDALEKAISFTES